MGPIICQLLKPLGRTFISSPLMLSNEPRFILIPQYHAVNNNSTPHKNHLFETSTDR